MSSTGMFNRHVPEQELSDLEANKFNTRSGYVAIMGRPNVGKSTLLNRIIGQKIAITSRKPQTTRHQLLGIKTKDSCQSLYVDTPGLHRDLPRKINRYMNRSALRAVLDVDVILLLVDRLHWSTDDEWVLEQIRHSTAPILLVINKIDLIADKSRLLPHLAHMQDLYDFAELLPVSATNGHNVEQLEKVIDSRLPLGEHYFPEDQITDRSSRFLVSEIIREKIMRQLGDELPYEATIQIDTFRQTQSLVEISALVLVEREGQKGILIGKEGSRLKLIGAEARKSIEGLLGTKTMLKLWVKVKAGWSDDERALRSLGYKD